jgi:ferrous iron transport protein A
MVSNDSPPLPLDVNLSDPGSIDDTSTAAPAHGVRAASLAGPLAAIRHDEPVQVVEVGLDVELAGWLEAMGLGPGQTLTLLRRAAFGGPIHVRTGSGGELAINAALARSILVAPVSPSRRLA